ncbi:leucine-rich repeat domain-containing protein [Halobacillus mangrovi]|uniref:Uncharacterized protein n=1 Tax=Halobacillus mangrovi TaxID=402384 RepID=A0A1W5ZRR1_9BACI|nr:hypothetical protein [Halobacillus mangrovi]ARI75961.1 hypothetical protein HM131_03560 [Halobacillus mangrovi]
MDNKKIKEAIDRKISKTPLFTEADRRRFYENRRKPKRRWMPAVPQVMSVLLVFLLISGSVYFINSGNPFENPADTPEQKLEDVPPPAPEESPTDEVKEIVEEIKNLIKTYHFSPETAQTLRELGEEVTQTRGPDGPGVDEIDGYMSTGDYIFLKGDNFNYSNTLSRGNIPSIEHFQREELGVFLRIKRGEVHSSATITYLSQDKEQLIQERYTTNGLHQDFEKVIGSNQPVEMQPLVQESIAQSLDKNPESLTKSDLLELEELKIDASNLNGIYDWASDPEVFRSMKNLRKLTLNQVKVSGELLKGIPHLEQVTFIGPTLDDLSNVAEGLQQVRYLNIQDSSFRGNADDILKLKSLNIVRLDKSIVTDYEKLQFEGIDVRW